MKAGETAALKQARSSGSQVEVGALRGESREVYAQPDGTFEAVEHLQPVRTRQNGKWVDIDTALRKRSDGSVSPGASTVDLSFNGGGTGPMATMVRAGRKLSFSWPGTLPAPVLSGATATYKDVISGVDLQLNADAEGFSDVLVVKTREAAQDPKLAQLKFTTAATGLILKEDEAGGLQATDTGGGGVVFEAPQPMMWDSATGPAAPKATRAMAAATGDPADGAEGSSHRAPIDVQVGSGAVTLTPDQTMLTDPATAFPVYIDPVYKTVSSSANLMVSSGGWKDYNFKGDEGMGYCPYSYTNDCGSPHKKRLFYRMPTSGFGGKTILSAEFQVKETFAPSCTNRNVELWKTKTFGTSSTWDSTSDNWLENLDHQSTAKGYSGCPAGDVILDATKAMKEAAAGGWSTLTLGLRASTEDDQLAWKRFDDDPSLRVHYNTPPPQPKMSNLTSSPGGACKAPASPARVNVPPKAYAVLTDPDTEDPNKVRGQFQAAWDDGTGWAQRWTSALTSAKASGSTFTATLPAGIPENTPVEWHVRAYDGTSYSPWSYAGNATGCYFLYDHTVPAAPAISSSATDGYPESNPDDENDPWYDGVGRYGKFTLTPSDPDVTKYQWGVNGDPTSAHQATVTAGAPATIDVMPETAGPNYLSVKAIDATGNTSATATYYFRVKAGADAKATYALDEPVDSPQIKDTNGANPADVHGGATLGVDGMVGKGMELNGTDGYASTSAPLLDTTKSFAVSAWARLTATKPDHAGIIATQAGAQKSGFELYYSSALDRWAFNRYTSDTTDQTLVRAVSATAPQGGAWTHLVGVYDAVAKTLSLYVNGTLAQTVPYTTPWNATGGLQIGVGSYGGVPGSFFSGDLDDVHVFDRVVTDEEARNLFTQRPVVAARYKLNDATSTVRTAKAYWKLDEAAGATQAVDAQGAFPAGAHGGVTFGGTGKVGKAMQLNGSTGYAATSGPVVDTTKSFSVSAWVKLAAKSATPIILSQEGSRGSAFALYYSATYDRWIFNMQTPDSDTPTYIRAQSTQPPVLNTWTHLTGVYDSDAQQIRLYADGKLQQTVAQPNTWASTGPLNLGRFKTKGTYVSYLNGALDDVRVFDQPLTDSEAAQLAGGAPSSVITSADDTLGGHHVSLFGNAYVDQGLGWVGNPPGGMVLDGDGDYAATTGPVVHTDQSFTVAGWVQTPGRPTKNAAVFSQEGNVNSAFTLRYTPDPDDQANAGGYQIDMPDKDATGETHQVAAHPAFQSNGDWDHVAIVYDAFADEMSLYVNGELEQSEDGPVSYRSNTLAFDAIKAFQIGRTKTDGTYGEYWPGVIDDVWILNGVASDDQIVRLANGTELAVGAL
ncbi:LamG domain-containing protein [Actinoallomurus bryophytorum]|uniref:LamG domain-containing protein n=1 Tax=Actinoallomurus bryophytorum TaxID=1490222 RepID=UPI00163AE05F|nr:LamG domain-containing protein [Actinoallomurus bryophytorum]